VERRKSRVGGGEKAENRDLDLKVHKERPQKRKTLEMQERGVKAGSSVRTDKEKKNVIGVAYEVKRGGICIIFSAVSGVREGILVTREKTYMGDAKEGGKIRGEKRTEVAVRRKGGGQKRKSFRQKIKGQRDLGE